MVQVLTDLLETDGRKPSRQKICSFCCKALYTVHVLPLIHVGLENGEPIESFKFPRVGVKDKEDLKGFASGFTQKLICTMTLAVSTVCKLQSTSPIRETIVAILHTTRRQLRESDDKLKYLEQHSSALTNEFSSIL